MSWAEAMKEVADVAGNDRPATGANIMRSATSATWDPYEVWLTRVKRPRELATRWADATTGFQEFRHPAG
jgi:hypothetical protein